MDQTFTTIGNTGTVLINLFLFVLIQPDLSHIPLPSLVEEYVFFSHCNISFI